MSEITLTMAEGESIMLETFRMAGITDVEAFPMQQRMNAVVGIVNAVSAMQRLGFRVSRPLREVSK